MRLRVWRTPQPIVTGLATVLMASVAIPAAAQEQSLPSAEVILDKHVEVTGGAEAWSQLENYVYEGLYGRPGGSREYEMIHYADATGRHVEFTRRDGNLVLERGLNGSVAWGRYAGRPAEQLSGDAEARLRYEWTFAPNANWREVFGNVKTEGMATVEGTECYVVTRRPDAGTPTETAYYDADTYRLLRVDVPRSVQGEKATLKTIYTNYREVDGLMIPHTITRRLKQSGRRFTILSAMHNVDLPEAQFAIPANLQPQPTGKGVADPDATKGNAATEKNPPKDNKPEQDEDTE